MGDQCLIQVAQHRLALQPARLHHRQQPLHEPATSFTPAAVAVLPPQHAAAQQPLGGMVVRRLHTLGHHEAPTPPAANPSTFSQKVAALASAQRLRPARSKRLQFLGVAVQAPLQGEPVDPPTPEQMPRLEHPLRDVLQLFGPAAPAAPPQSTSFLKVPLGGALPNRPGDRTATAGRRPTNDRCTPTPSPSPPAARSGHPSRGGRGSRRQRPCPSPPPTASTACQPVSNSSHRRSWGGRREPLPAPRCAPGPRPLSSALAGGRRRPPTAAPQRRHRQSPPGRARSDVVTASQISEGSGQPRPDAVGLEVAGDRGVVERAATRAGAEVALVFRDPWAAISGSSAT